MQILLRQLRQRADGQVEYQDTELAVDELLLGSAPHCQLHWVGDGIAPQHASLRAAAGGVTLNCRRGCSVTVNGATTASATLQPGDELRLAQHRLRVVPPPGGFGLALECESSATAATGRYENAFRTRLDQTWLSMRAFSWALLALVPLLMLALPLYSLRLQHAHHAVPAALITDRAWTAGPLLAAHQLTTAATCSSCHQTLFVHVQDRACTSCHRRSHSHVSAARLAEAHAGEQPRCASCHLEHGGTTAHLRLATGKLCTDCHADAAASPAKLGLPAIRGFAAGMHPDWKPLVAASGLKFSHAQHLDVRRVHTGAEPGASLEQRASAKRRALNCADCHQLAADGEHFAPLSMERNCRSCHELTFDDGLTQRQLPHGSASDAIALIQDYFARRAVDPAATARLPPQRRAPDRVAAVRCTAAAFECATRAATREIILQFEQQGCVVCHRVGNNGNPDPLQRYAIAPVRVNTDLLPAARFRHSSHLIQAGKSGDAACLGCHAATRATGATGPNGAIPSMVPAIGNCLACHDTAATPARLPLQCMSCHSYHPAAAR
jgi:hypothetical protein